MFAEHCLQLKLAQILDTHSDHLKEIELLRDDPIYKLLYLASLIAVHSSSRSLIS